MQLIISQLTTNPLRSALIFIVAVVVLYAIGNHIHYKLTHKESISTTSFDHIGYASDEEQASYIVETDANEGVHRESTWDLVRRKSNGN